MSWIPRSAKLVAGLATIGASAAVWTLNTDSTQGWSIIRSTNKLDRKWIKTPLGSVSAATRVVTTAPWDSDWDGQASKSRGGRFGDRHIFLIRHGQYDMSSRKDEDRILTSLGRKQAESTGKRLEELGHDYDVLTVSTMTRAQETADIIIDHLSKGIQWENCDLLREGFPIVPVPYSKRDPHVDLNIEKGFKKHFHRASSDQSKDSYEVIVCHANVIRYFVLRALQLPPEAWLRFSLRHGSITHIKISSSGNVSVRMMGEAGYMPPDMQTTM